MSVAIPSHPPTRRGGLLLALGLIFAMNAAFGWWLIGGRLAAKSPAGFYGYQTEAFLAGQLHLKLAPHPRLAELPNPYVGDQNRPYRILDLSYYRGKYYSYFGVAPVIFLTLPWRVVTGTYLTEPGATFMLGMASAAMALALVWRLRERFYADAPDWAVTAAGAVLVLGNFTSIHLIGANPGTVAQQGAVLGLLGTAVALCGAIGPHSAGTSRAMVLASVSAGLAVACRPSFFPVIGLVAPVVLVAWRQDGPAWWRRCACAIVPFGAIIAMLLAYNYVRFDSPFEFGNRFQLTDVDYRRLALLSADFFGQRAGDFLVRPPSLAHYFPFFADRHDLLPVGLIWTTPFVLMTAALIPAWFRRRGRAGEATLLEAGLLLAWVGLFGLLACYRVFLFHYQVDFIVPAVLLGVLGWFSLWDASRRRRNGLVSLGAVLGATTIGVASLSTLALVDCPTALPRLTRFVNGWVAAWDDWRGVRHGSVRLTVKFGPDAVGRSLPLVVTGANDRDICYVKVGADATIQVGLFHAGLGGPLSEPVSIDLAAPHQFEIRMGSLLPGARHPLFDRWDDLSIARARSVFTVSLDGQPVLATAADYHPSSPDSCWIGRSPVAMAGISPTFAGQVLAVERLKFGRDWLGDTPAVSTGAAVVRFRMPEKFPVGGAEPLLSTGEAGRGDVAFVRYESDSQVVFGLDHRGGGAQVTLPVSAAPGEVHTLAVIADAFGGTGPTAGRFALMFDGAHLLNRRLATHPSTPGQIAWGLNTSGSTVCGRMFGGTILSVSAADPEALLAHGDGLQVVQAGTLLFKVRFRPDDSRRPEPLVVTGRPGQADFLYVMRESVRQLRFGFDHWGAGGGRSESVDFDPDQPHAFEIDFGSIHALPGGRAQWADRYEVRMDGRVVFSGTAQFHPTTLGEVTIGTNLVGGSTTSEALSGKITDFQIRPR